MSLKFKVGDIVRYVGDAYPTLTKESVGVIKVIFNAPIDTFLYDVKFKEVYSILLPCAEEELELITNG